MHHRLRQAATLALLALAAVPRPLAAQADVPCARNDACADVSSFSATVVDFRESVSGRHRLVAATIRFRNGTDDPLILGYVAGSGLVTDDRGNRYTVRTVRGLGEITTARFDPKFVLAPDESSDARFELAWQPGRGEIYGTRYDIDLAVREIVPVTTDQYRLGKEHALRFSGFGSGAQTAAARGEAGGTDAPDPADPCEGNERCHSAGPFAAEVLRVSRSTRKPYNDNILEVTVRFSNLHTEALILGYTSHSSLVVDEVGNRYVTGRPGTVDNSTRGMGMVTGRSADPSFRLEPGKSRNATFKVWFRAGRRQVGTRYAFDVTIEELEVLPSRQVRSVREYALGFQNLTAGRWSGSGVVDALLRGAIDRVAKP